MPSGTSRWAGRARRAHHASPAARRGASQARRGWSRTAGRVAAAGGEGRQVEVGARVHHATGQVLGRHTITQPSRHVQADYIINGFAGSAQTRQSSTDGPGGSTFLSDRLLERTTWTIDKTWEG